MLQRAAITQLDHQKEITAPLVSGESAWQTAASMEFTFRKPVADVIVRCLLRLVRENGMADWSSRGLPRLYVRLLFCVAAMGMCGNGLPQSSPHRVALIVVLCVGRWPAYEFPRGDAKGGLLQRGRARAIRAM